MFGDALRKVFSFPVMLASIIVFWVFIGTGYAVWDADIWWHLRNAEYLFTYLKTPQIDLYSYTTNSHAWMNHEWLGEIPYYLAWRAGGLMGIYAVSLSLLLVILLGIFYWAYKQSGNLKGAFVVSCFSVFLAVVSFGPRTILFGYIYLLILLLLLARYRSTGQSPLWVIPPLFCLWINTHGSWLLGLIMFGIYVVSGLVEGSWGRVEAVRWTPQQSKRLLLTAGASVAALFVNPFTYRLVFYPFDLAFRQKLNIGNVEEWASVDFNDARGKVVMILLAVVFLGALFSRHTWRLEELLMAGFGLYTGLMHIRFLFLAAILLAPLLAKMLDFVPPYQPGIDKPPLNALVIGVVLLIAIYRVPSRADLEKDVAVQFPANALSYIKANALQNRVFNDYGWGGYLIFFSRDVKTFVDGRTDIFEYTGVLKDYLDATQIRSPLEVLDKYEIHSVLLSPDAPLTYLLENQRGWKKVFSDRVAVIFVRAPAAQAISAAEPSARGSR